MDKQEVRELFKVGVILKYGNAFYRVTEIMDDLSATHNFKMITVRLRDGKKILLYPVPQVMEIRPVYNTPLWKALNGN